MTSRRIGAVAALALLAASCGGDSPDTAADLGFCELVEAFATSPDPFEDLDLTDTEAARDGFEEYAGRMERLVDAAPEELAADVEIVASFFSDFISVIAEADFDVFAVSEQLTELQNRSSEVLGPTERVREYAQAECGATLGDLPGAGEAPTDEGGDSDEGDGSG